MSLVAIYFTHALVFVKIVGLDFSTKDTYTFFYILYFILIEGQDDRI